MLYTLGGGVFNGGTMRVLSTVVRGNTVRRTEGAAFYCARCSHDLFEQNVVEQAGYPFARAFGVCARAVAGSRWP